MTYITKIKKFSVGGCKNRNIWYKKHEVTVTHLLTSNISMRFTKYRHIYKTLLKCMSSIPDIKYIFWKWKKKVYFQFKIKHLRSKLSANSHMNSTFLSYNEYFNNEFISGVWLYSINKYLEKSLIRPKSLNNFRKLIYHETTKRISSRNTGTGSTV